MVIQKYFNELKVVVDRYSTTSYVIDASINFDIRPAEQGYLKGEIHFSDKSSLHFKEFIDADEDKKEKGKR